MRHTLLIAALLLQPGCDRSEDILTQGAQGARQAREITAGNAEQQVSLAADLISVGKLTDAENLVRQLSAVEDTLSPAAREKLQTVREQLAAARAR